MTFADVLLRVVPNSPMELERLSVAVDLTRRLQGKLNGFFISKEDDSKSGWAQALFERSVARSPWRQVGVSSTATATPAFCSWRAGPIWSSCRAVTAIRPDRAADPNRLLCGRDAQCSSSR